MICAGVAGAPAGAVGCGHDRQRWITRWSDTLRGRDRSRRWRRRTRRCGRWSHRWGYRSRRRTGGVAVGTEDVPGGAGRFTGCAPGSLVTGGRGMPAGGTPGAIPTAVGDVVADSAAAAGSGGAAMSGGGPPSPTLLCVPMKIGARSSAVSSCVRTMCGVSSMTMSD